jgi:serine/threonine-protein kinase 24/25/MST4
MEYLGGGSAQDIIKMAPFSERDIAVILREILKGLDYLHSERKVHRDIKGTPSISQYVSRTELINSF